MNELDRLATQRHALFPVLLNHTGERLTPSKIEEVLEELIKEVQTGPCAWAFKVEFKK